MRKRSWQGQGLAWQGLAWQGLNRQGLNRQGWRWLRWGFGTLGISLILNLFLFFKGPSWATVPLHYTDLSFPPLPEITIPDYTRFQLDNGLVVYLVEDHELPLVKGTAIFRTGSRWEPEAQVGLAGMTGYLLRDGGTQNHPVDAINTGLEQRAATIETSMGSTAGTASFTSLSEDLPEVFALFAEILQQPRFAQERFDLAQARWRGSLDRRNDDPGDIANREFQKLIYGANHPYGRTVEYVTLDQIQRQDVVEFYDRFIRPNRTILGIVGDFEPRSMRQTITEIFGSWQPTAEPLPALPTVDPIAPGQVFVVTQPQMTQSYVQMGHLGGRLDDPAYPALTVLNEVLNGQGGRLFDEVRSRQGLAYSVYSIWQASYDSPGYFVAGGQTRTETTLPFIEAIDREIETIRSQPITPKELDYAKDVVLNSLVFSFQTPDQTLYRLMRYEYYGYPQDFIFKYQRAVERVTIADIQEAAQTYLQPDQLVTLVVGNLDSSLKAGLAQLSITGQVQELDISINGKL